MRNHLLLSAFAAAAVLCSVAAAEEAAPAASSAATGKAFVVLSVTHDEETGAKASTAFFVDSTSSYGLLDRKLLRSIENVLGIPRGSDFKEIYGTVFVLELPAGTHQIDRWETTYAQVHLSPTTPPPPLQFEARAGEVIYLGNLNMVNRLGRPSFVSPWVPVGGTPEVRDRQSVDIPIAEAKVSAIKGAVTVRLLPLGTWGVKDPETVAKRTSPLFLSPLPAKR